MDQACHRGDPGSILYHVRCVPDKVALGQVCAGHIGTGTDLCRTHWHWDRFVPDTVALGQVSLRLRRLSPIRVVTAMHHSNLYSHFYANSCQKDERVKP